jgi:hypothetical protein
VIEIDQGHLNAGLLRPRHAETIDLWPQTQDVSVVLVNTHGQDGQPFTIFDGHGCRESPAGMAYRVTYGLEIAYTAAFAQVQSDMQTWCVDAGAIRVPATIDANMVTYADIGYDR